ncbi:hypothetical protein AVEN_86948-1 [Araneus ventricosus]|uniref:Uncharacterized protein n=1 Tax=Araneus ventricosus TaxID=182803 RepID=A0A4Y2V0L2_ARAVE|nr:hypothetical protein AVEN_70000-1 [Araneus ventricosus]GBO17298.1 hypothetical protein AVEN_86948-1 [Araneus ventricosus]
MFIFNYYNVVLQKSCDILMNMSLEFRVNPDSNFRLQQSCSSLAQKVFSKFDMARPQVHNKFSEASKSPHVELAANLSRQVHCKRVEKREHAFEPQKSRLSNCRLNH